MILLSLFALTLTSASADTYFGRQCNFDRTYPSSSFADAFQKPIEISEFDKSSARFCDDALIARFLRTQNQKPIEINGKVIGSAGSGASIASDKEINEARANGTLRTLLESRITDIRAFGTPWEQSLIPMERGRMAPLNHISADLYNKDGERSEVTLDEALDLLRMEPYSAQKLSRPARKTDEFSYDFSGRYKFPLESAAYLYACGELVGVTKANECLKPFRFIRQMATPNGKGITAAATYAAVLLDNRYNEGLRRAGLIIGSRVNERSETASDLFTDLKRSFRASGEDADSAEEMTWRTIGMISTAGPNIDRRFDSFDYDPGQFQKRIAISTIANSLPILDHRSSQRGHIYSLPATVTGRCNSGKTYHFWFPAYLAREAALTSGEIEGSAAAAFQTTKAYHLLERDIDHERKGRSRTDLIISDDLYSAASDVIRMDFAYAAAGSLYGSHSSKSAVPAELSIDKNVRQLLRDAGHGTAGLIPTLLSKLDRRIDFYSALSVKFSPNSAYSASTANLSTGKIYDPK